MEKENIKAHKLLEHTGNSILKIAFFKGRQDYTEKDVKAMYHWLRTFKKE